MFPPFKLATNTWKDERLRFAVSESRVSKRVSEVQTSPVRMCGRRLDPIQRLRKGSRPHVGSSAPSRSRRTTTCFNKASFCLGQHNRAECSVRTGNAARLPLLFQPCVENACRVGGGSMLSNAEIGKCHFDKCKALCTHRLNFDGSLPRRGLLFLFIDLHTKMLNNDFTESKYKCHQRTRPPMNPPFFSSLKVFFLKDRQAFEALLKRARGYFWENATRGA